MNNEEIDYWLRYFSNHNHGFMSEDGKIITLFKVFQELKELQRLLKIQNDYIKELEAYKYNMDRDYLRLEKENQSLKKENKILRENAEHNDKIVDKVNWENQLLNKQLEEANEKILLLQASEPMLEYKKALEENQQKEFIEYLEKEKYRLAGECSQIYEDSLGKIRLVNTDIVNEVDKILSKYYEIIDKLESGE